MADVTVFVDTAVLGRLPPICVKEGSPTADRLTVQSHVSGGTGLGVAWLLVLLGPLGWLGLIVIRPLATTLGPAYRQGALLREGVPAQPGCAPQAARVVPGGGRFRSPRVRRLSGTPFPPRTGGCFARPLCASRLDRGAARVASRLLGDGRSGTGCEPPLGHVVQGASRFCPSSRRHWCFVAIRVGGSGYFLLKAWLVLSPRRNLRRTHDTRTRRAP